MISGAAVLWPNIMIHSMFEGDMWSEICVYYMYNQEWHYYISQSWSESYHCELCLCSMKTSPAIQSLRSEGIVPTG